MPSRKYVRARHYGECAAEFMHPNIIRPGDLTCVTTHFPSDESVRYFGAEPFARTRVCEWCILGKAIRDAARNEFGLLQFRDKHGDVWVFGSDGKMHTPETRPFDYEYVQRKFGPLRVCGTEGVRP